MAARTSGQPAAQRVGPPEGATWERDVLPVFYYNDLLASRIGDTVALNLFEPRFLHMCQRMATDPRFIFMPNFEDYCCLAGDVGFIVRVDSVVPQRGGQAYSIRGVAVEMMAVACTWVEPGTRGLHYAQYWTLDHQIACLSHSELDVLCDALLQDHGWRQLRDFDFRLLLKSPAMEGDGGLILVGCNWPDRAFLMGSEAKAPEVLSLHLQAVWASLAQSMPRQRFSMADFAAQALHRLPHLVSWQDLPTPDRASGPTLGDVCEDLMALIRADGRGVLAEAGLPEQGGPLNQRTWNELLQGVRICAIGGMCADLPTVRLELCFVPVAFLQESLPRTGAGAGAGAGQEGEAAVRVTNGTNVHFYVRPRELRATPTSAAGAVAALRCRLNRPRLRLLRRARLRGQGLLALLGDDAALQVCDFIAVKPLRDGTGQP